MLSSSTGISYEQIKEFLEKRVHKIIKYGDPDFETMYSVLTCHPNFNNWKRVVVEYFRITRSPKKKAIQVFVKMTDAKERQVSWVKCSNKSVLTEEIVNQFKSKDTISKQLTQAMRTAIKDQMDTWKSSVFGNRKCEWCGKLTGLEADHHPKKFSQIKKSFLEQVSLNDLVVPNDFDWYNSRYHFKKKDETFELQWSRYHMNEATYRWLCSSCNQKNK